MTPTPRTITIESRERLLSTLAEAAELEHTLMCLYLYAVFSFKRSTEEGLTGEELKAVDHWRTTLLHICTQEMVHLALVANLTTALGGSAHFFRPAFPVRPGCFPADFVVELAPFDQTTLQHFMFLECPEDEPIADSQAFTPASDYVRETPRGRLMAHPGAYATVGQLYAAIERGIEFLCAQAGEPHPYVIPIIWLFHSGLTCLCTHHFAVSRFCARSSHHDGLIPCRFEPQSGLTRPESCPSPG